MLSAGLLCLCWSAQAQQLLKNGTFDNTTANWTTACTTVEATNFETTYGGFNSTNRVAEIDDESCFYQDICVLPGKDYTFSMNASRRSGSPTPNPLTCHLKIEGLDAANAVVGTPLVNMNFTRNNTTFNFTPVAGIPLINVAVGSGIVRLRITLKDNTTSNTTHGMIIDDLSLTYVVPEIVSADTICQERALSLNIDGTSAGTTYDWDFGAGAAPAISATAAPSVVWSTPGLKTVRCILGNGTCIVDTVVKDIYVDTPPGAPAVSSPVNYCTGDIAAPLTASGTGLLWYTTATGGTGSAGAPVPSTAGAGTFTYYVSQSNNYCESPRSAIDVVVYERPVVNLGSDTVLCDTSFQLKLQAPFNPGFSYTWQDGSSGNSYLAQRPGTYQVTVSNPGCSVTDDIVVKGYLLRPDLGEDTVVCAGEPFSKRLSVEVPDGASVVWSTGSTSPAITVTQPGTYKIKMTQEICTGSDEMVISQEICDCITFVPDAFSPNGDGRNDVFRPIVAQGCEITGYRLDVYDRWGKLVFNTRKTLGGWDGTYAGTKAELGVYMFTVSYEKGTKGKLFSRKGNVTLVR